MSRIAATITCVSVLLATLGGCSSSVKTYDVNLDQVDTYYFKNAAESVGLQARIIEVMDAKGYTLTDSPEDALVFEFAADNNAWGTGRGVLATYRGQPVLSSESSNAGFGTLILAGSERSRMESNVVAAVNRNIPDALD